MAEFQIEVQLLPGFERLPVLIPCLRSEGWGQFVEPHCEKLLFGVAKELVAGLVAAQDLARL